jgi:hydroxyethylthiazole kinase-like uncharacterized protein yjeF
MEAAGSAVADVAMSQFPGARKVLIVCGSGNNAGDGFIAARHMMQSGVKVDVYHVGDEARIRGDAALAKSRMPADIKTISQLDAKAYDLIVDGLFGAGLDRDVKGKAASVIDAVNNCSTPVLAVDLPSGIDGASGKVCGVAIKADASVTFFRKKPGHVLYPGRAHCGRVFVHQIGIRPAVLHQTGIAATINQPKQWLKTLPVFEPIGHKYHRGHTLVVSGPLPMSGAARLVAGAALRAGSGLVTLASSKEVLAANAASLTSIMLYRASSADDLRALLVDKRFNCVAIGPGLAPNKKTRTKVLAVLSAQHQCVLDAGALSAFENDAGALFSTIKANPKPVVLTPHDGEFSRLFKDECLYSSKIERAQKAAIKSGAIIVLKGPDTVVASPDGMVSIADNAPPWLATAGSGDVLTGIIAGLLAQGMPAFEAASAAVWIHGDAACRLGPPLISSDLDEGLRRSFSALFSDHHKN